MPDWWQIANFTHTGVDPYGDPDVDGWSNLEEFQNGTDPNNFNTPHAPTGLAVGYNGSSTNIIIRWNPSSGAVTGYTLIREIPELGTTITNNLSSTTTNFSDNPFPLANPNPQYAPPTYQLYAHYSLGDSTWTDKVALYQYADEGLVFMERGPGGRNYLVSTDLPRAVKTVRLERYDYHVPFGYPPLTTNFDISLSSFTNGVFQVPDAWAPPLGDSYNWVIAGLDESNRVNHTLGGSLGNYTVPFLDGREQLKQNLEFQLRAANVSDPFEFYWTDNDTFGSFIYGNSDYVYSSIFTMAEEDWTPGKIDVPFSPELQPFLLNSVYRNFAYSSSNLNSAGFLNTGVDASAIDYLTLNEPAYYRFVIPTNLAAIPSVLPTNSSRWTYYYPIDDFSDDLSLAGMSIVSTNLSLSNSAHNLFGLAYSSAVLAWGNGVGENATVNAGGSALYHVGYVYPETAQPILTTLGYYFVKLPEDFEFWFGPKVPVPGISGFTVTNSTPLLVASVGESIRIAGYAKQSVANGTSGKYAYLGQYFDKAYKVGTNGLASSAETGLLSEYGEFFPTESGPTALVTMTNWGVNERGTGVVHVISLSTDANHDGKIDTSFHGPDFTSASRPFRFWVNDDNDSDDTGGNDIPNYPATVHGIPNGLDEYVNGVRDLVDFFPVYLNIQSLLQAYPSNSLSVWLKQADGALNFVDTSFYEDSNLTPTNCLAYLTDTNIAKLIGRITPSKAPTYQIPNYGHILDSGFVNKIRSNGKGIVLIEARAATTEPLVLEVYNGTNLIAQTSLYLRITGVEQMFRQKNLIRETFAGSKEGFNDRIADSDVPNESETNDKSFIFLHGYNVSPNQARGTFAEVFKRLFWSGSHAKFYGVNYRGNEGQWFGKITPSLQTNIVNAFLTAPKLAGFLNTLTNGPTVAAAHSLGNMVALSAVSDWNANVNVFFMLDAAVGSEALDGSTTPSANMIHPDWTDYATRLTASEWHTLFPTNDYRSALTWRDRFPNLGASELYNFYSSGEEVLRTHVGLPPDDILDTVLTEITYLGTLKPVGVFTWAWQEKTKGRASYDGVLGSTHGGWGFNMNSPYYYTTNGQFTHMPNSQASLLPTAQLQTNSFFSMTSSSFTSDGALLGTGGSAYAQTNSNRIISDAIPCLTLAVGANAVNKLDVDAGEKRNFDMQTEFKNGWPLTRTTGEGLNWHHSDFKEVAYTYVYKVFVEIVNDGNLK